MEEKEYQAILTFVTDHVYPPGVDKRNFRRKCVTFCSMGGKLFHKGNKCSPPVLVLKEGDVEHALQSTHAAEHGGHLGIHKTWEKLSSRFYWKGSYEVVANYIKTCEKCQKKADLKKAKKPLRPIAVPSEAFNQVGMDLVGPLDTTVDGNKYIAVFTDYFSKWVEAEAIPNKSAEVVSRVFVKLICTHGCPFTLITDQGRKFCNTLNENICRQMGVDHKVASAYHPQTGGHTERFNRTLCNMLANFVNEQNNDWDKKLPFVLFAYRTAKHSSTKKTPFYLVYGREPRLPVELDLSAPMEVDTSNEDSLKQRCDSFLTLSRKKTETQANIKKAQEKQKRNHDASLSKSDFKVGDKVLMHNTRKLTRKGGKLQPKWKGPYTIRKKSSKGTFYLDGIKAPINGSRLVFYKTENDMFEKQMKRKNQDNTTSPKASTYILDEPRDEDVQLPLKKRKLVNTDSIVLDDIEDQSTLSFSPVDMEWQIQTAKLFERGVKNRFVSVESKKMFRNTKPLKTALIRGDGNCLFRAFSYVVFGVQTFYKQVRATLVNYIRHNENIMEQATLRPVNQYLSESSMSKDATWGTEVEIYAFASISGTPVYVFSQYGEKMKWLEYKPFTKNRSNEKAVFIQNINQHFVPVLDIQD